jgi:hypothetical protein
LFVEDELHSWLDGAVVEAVELPNDRRIVRIARSTLLVLQKYSTALQRPR